MKTKTSYGIALCRYNKSKNNNVELILVKKRYSYALLSIVMGHYKKNDMAYIKYLCNNTSCAEKIDMIGMVYCQLWYRIWLNNPERYYNITDVYRNTNFSNSPIENRYTNADIYKIYSERKHRFENNFLKDNGKKLRNIIKQSSDAEILWEIPKGRKNFIDESNISGKCETNVDCAIREFYEETSIKDDKYKILYDAKPIIDSFIDNDTHYKTVYYIAALNPNLENFTPYIDFKNFDQITEIEQIKWVSMAEITFFNLPKSSHNRLINLYTNIINTFKTHKKFKKLKL